MALNFAPYIKKHQTSWDELAEQFKSLGQESTMADSHLSAPDQEWDSYLKRATFAMEWLVNKSDAVHIFIQSSNFVNWLISCVPDVFGDAKYLKDAISISENKFPCVVHFPTSSGYSSFIYWAGDQNKELMLLDISRGNKSGIGTLAINANHIGEIDKQWLPYVKIVLALGMYVSCFPETVKTGPPDDLRHPSLHSYKSSQTIEVSPKIVNPISHESPTAHFRKGHFRILQSEKFTNKRFQVIFVRQTFVKGKAVTIVSPEEATVCS
jgi:hypothetical protein